MPKDLEQARCAKCKFWEGPYLGKQRDQRPDGYCHRYPERLETYGHYWCGEFELQKEKELL